MKLKKMNVKNMKLDIGFNKKLYFDGIRQLKLVGIMGMVVLCAAAVLTAVGYHINTPLYTWDGMGNMIRRAQEGLNLYQAHWSLFMTFPILVPVMTMMLFNFLNHRNASDFYHAIPDTRGTLYISYSAAILTWVGAIIGISALLSVFCVSILPGYYIIWSGVPKALFLILAACVLVEGSVSIALGLTGTRISNLMVTLIILFLPRLFVTVVMYILEGMMPFVAWEYSSSLFNPRYDLIAGIPLSLFSGVNPFQYGSSGVYSLILGLIYLVAGYVIFLRRKSESAGHAAITPKMQSVFRLAVSMMICLLPMYYIAECWVDSDILDGETLFIILVFYVIAVLAYFIYELMTTGKLRAFRKLCRGIGILAGLNVALFFVIIGIYGTTIKNTPEAEEIDYIRIRGEERDYFEAQLQRMRIRDDEVKEITANALKRTIERYSDNRYYSGYVDHYGNHVETVYQTVAINVGMRTIYRDVYYTVTEWNTIVEHLSQLPEYYQVYCDLPEYSAKEMSIYCDWGNLSTDQLIKVYNVMREEVKSVDLEEWYAAVDGYSSGKEQYVDSIRLTLDVGTTGYRDTIRLPILPSMTDTLVCYFEQQNSEEVDGKTQRIWRILCDLIDGETEDGLTANYLSLRYDLRLIKGNQVLDGIDGNIEGYQSNQEWKIDMSGIKKDSVDDFQTFMEKLMTNQYTIDPENDILIVIELYGSASAYNEYGKRTDYNESYRRCVSLPEPIPEEIEAWLGEVINKLEQ